MNFTRFKLQAWKEDGTMVVLMDTKFDEEGEQKDVVKGYENDVKSMFKDLVGGELSSKILVEMCQEKWKVSVPTVHSRLKNLHEMLYIRIEGRQKFYSVESEDGQKAIKKVEYDLEKIGVAEYEEWRDING